MVWRSECHTSLRGLTVQCVWHRTQTFKQLHRRSLLLSLRMPRSAVALAVAIVMVSVGAGQAQVGPGALASFAAESAQLSTSGTPATVDVGVGGRTIAPATDLRRCEDLIPIHKAYTLRRLADSNTSFDPFEHITVHDIFHPEVYACMLAHLPKPGANYGGTISKGLRSYVHLSDGNGKCILPSAFLKSQKKYLQPTFQAFWHAFSKHFAGIDMRDAWIAKFHATLGRRFPDVLKAVKDHKMYYRLDLSRDGINYFINPHTDSVAKVITILYYLPLDGNHPELGTVAFKSKTGLKDDGRGMTWRDEERGDFRQAFEPIVKGQFVPNTVFAFAPCTAAWHGVYKVTERLQRDTLQGFVTMPMSGKEKTKTVSLAKSKAGERVKGECVGPTTSSADVGA